MLPMPFGAVMPPTVAVDDIPHWTTAFTVVAVIGFVAVILTVVFPNKVLAFPLVSVP